jgi:hypothetical protein
MVSHQKIGVTRINRKVHLNATRVSTSSYRLNAQSRFIDVVTQDAEKVMTEVTQKRGT